MMSEDIKKNNSMSFEEVIDKYGSLMWKGSGKSMKPFIREEKDLVYIVPAVNLKPMDVVLYKTDGRYILHRLMKEDSKNYYFLGDNCIKMERVPKGSVIGVMSSLIRDGKKYDLKSLRYRLYLALWIRPWRMRGAVIAVKRKVARLLGI